MHSRYAASIFIPLSSQKEQAGHDAQFECAKFKFNGLLQVLLVPSIYLSFCVIGRRTKLNGSTCSGSRIRSSIENRSANIDDKFDAHDDD